jgi:Ni/Fe-hydrogenase subunit HybB-like protein
MGATMVVALTEAMAFLGATMVVALTEAMAFSGPDAFSALVSPLFVSLALISGDS